MKLVSFNVNGIRACKGKGFVEFVSKKRPDVLCLQEVKASYEQADLDELRTIYPYIYWNAAERPGYSGVAILSTVEPLSVKKGMGLLDEEGRVLTLELKDFFLVNVYTPNSKPDLARVDFRHKEWDVAFLKYVKKLEKTKPVVFCGDLNVAHCEIDLARPKNNMTTEKSPGNAGFTDKEREGFSNIVKAGFIDTFRFVNKDKVQYSWWTYRFNARKNNVGWRIDYFCVSDSLKKKVKDAQIWDDVFGSDHCPVYLELA